MSQAATRFLRELAADFDLRPILERPLPQIDIIHLHTIACQRGYEVNMSELAMAIKVFKRVTSGPFDSSTSGGLLG
jgi:hypothetical protein